MAGFKFWLAKKIQKWMKPDLRGYEFSEADQMKSQISRQMTQIQRTRLEMLRNRLSRLKDKQQEQLIEEQIAELEDELSPEEPADDPADDQDPDDLLGNLLNNTIGKPIQQHIMQNFGAGRSPQQQGQQRLYPIAAEGIDLQDEEILGIFHQYPNDVLVQLKRQDPEKIKEQIIQAYPQLSRRTIERGVELLLRV